MDGQIIHNIVHIILASIVAHLYWQPAQLSTQEGDVGMSSSAKEKLKTHSNIEWGEEFIRTILAAGSSVSCQGTHHTNRICHFENLCYIPSLQNFVFFHSDQSFLDGLPENRFDPTLLELSSVVEHNSNYFNYIDLPIENVEELLTKQITVISDKVLMFRRFNPGNIMHVLHDDLLPLHHTLQLVTIGQPRSNHSTFNVQLLLMDGMEDGEFIHLYAILSRFPLMMKKDITESVRPVCFTNIVAGLSKHSTWYQYGFHEPQGPIPTPTVTALEIHKFTSFYKSKWNISTSHSIPGNTAVVLSRKGTRLILNEGVLVMELVKVFKMKVVVMGLETDSVEDIVSVISGASLIIGMHGSLLILSMFLPPGAALVELFPYAINPDNYTPYKTLTSLPGMDIGYLSWRNMDPAASVPHPDRSWDEGGIAHLSKEEQGEIINHCEVLPHLCCRDASWLYRIYQDTYIDINALISIIRDVLSVGAMYRTQKRKNLISSRIYPSEVYNIQCSTGVSGNTLTVSFEMPINLEYLNVSPVQYEVWLENTGNGQIKAWILSNPLYTFTEGLSSGVSYLVWVRCIVNGDTKGPFNAYSVQCVV